MLRRALLSMSRSERVRHLVETAPVSRSVVARFVAGTSAEDAVAATRDLESKGLLVSLDRLGEDTLDLHQATDTRDAYLRLLELLAAGGLTSGAEVSVKLSAVGQALPGDGEKVALENARAICEAARAAGTTVTLDMEDHTTTDSTLEILRKLRADFPETGAVLQAYLHRTEADCRDLAYAGSRVRLCKGAYKEPETVAFQGKHDVDTRVRPGAEGADGRRGLPDARDPRPPARSPSPRTSPAATAAPRTASSSRCSTASARTSRNALPRRGRRSGSTCRTATSGTATWSEGWPSAPPTSRSSYARWPPRGRRDRS